MSSTNLLVNHLPIHAFLPANDTSVTAHYRIVSPAVAYQQTALVTPRGGNKRPRSKAYDHFDEQYDSESGGLVQACTHCDALIRWPQRVRNLWDHLATCYPAADDVKQVSHRVPNAKDALPALTADEIDYYRSCRQPSPTSSSVWNCPHEGGRARPCYTTFPSAVEKTVTGCATTARKRASTDRRADRRLASAPAICWRTSGRAVLT